MENLSHTIAKAYETFCQRKTSDSEPDVVVVSGIRFLGIDVKHKASVSVAEARRILLEPFSADGNLRLVQVVGDSGSPVHRDKVLYSQELLEKYINDATVIEYGFTSSKYDANWLVESLATRDPAIATRLVGNIVQQSLPSITSPGWSACQKIKHLIFVYSTNDIGTSFGDDIWLSDGIMKGDADDMMICFEGGMQAFQQCVNALTSGIKVVAVTDLRHHEDVRRFSAAVLLSYMVEEGLSEEKAETYLEQHPPRSTEQRREILHSVRRLMSYSVPTANLVIEKPRD